MNLVEVAKEVKNCEGCVLHATRCNTVPGSGNPQAKIMLVGEGPGAEEDIAGVPFVGASGKLINEGLEGAGLSRADVFITNIIKCRPPSNRNPTDEEMAACEVFLWQQVDAIKPKLIIGVGKVASSFLLGRNVKILEEHGHLHFPPFAEAMMTIYHPAYLLRNQKPEVKKAFLDAFKDAYAVVYK